MKKELSINPQRLRIKLSALLLFGFLQFAPTSIGAMGSPEEKLVEVYGKERVQEMKEENPAMYEQLLFRVAHSFKLIPAREGKSYKELDQLPYYARKKEKEKRISAKELLQKVEEGSFNPLKCRLERKKAAPTLYELKGTGKVLLLRSEEELAKKFNETR